LLETVAPAASREHRHTVSSRKFLRDSGTAFGFAGIVPGNAMPHQTHSIHIGTRHGCGRVIVPRSLAQRASDGRGRPVVTLSGQARFATEAAVDDR
jgi:hypothetical protein